MSGSVYSEGYIAYSKNKRLEDNPYPSEPDKRSAWRAGYRRAQKDGEERGSRRRERK